MSVSQAMSWRMLLQDVRPVHPALAASLFRHGISVPQSTVSCFLNGNMSGKPDRVSSESSSQPSKFGSRAHGGTGRRRSSSAGCASGTLMQRTAIFSVARRNRCARAAMCHLPWLTFFCLVRVFAEAELSTSVASVRTLRFVTFSGMSRPGFRQAVYFPLSEPSSFL